MKTVQQKMKRRAGIVGMICLLTAFLSSCVKDSDTAVNLPPSGLLTVINASPDATNADFYLDSKKINSNAIPYGNGLDYLGVYTGKRTAAFNIAGTTTVIKTDTMTFNADKIYSLYLTNLVSRPDYLLTRDTISKPAAGMATVRLVNVSSDAPALDLAIKSGAVLAPKKAYRTYSSFVAVPGNTPLILEVRQNSNSAVLLTLNNITLRTGSVYTVWVHGLVAGTGTSVLVADIQNNAYY